MPTLAFLGEHDMEMVAHPPYSPDLAPCDFFLFPHLKKNLWGKCFANLAEMKKGVLAELRQIDQDDYRKAIDDMVVRWVKCVESGDEYFEGRHVDITAQEEDSDTDRNDVSFNQDEQEDD